MKRSGHKEADIRNWLQSGKSVSQIVKAANVSIQTVYNWRKQYSILVPSNQVQRKRNTKRLERKTTGSKLSEGSRSEIALLFNESTRSFDLLIRSLESCIKGFLDLRKWKTRDSRYGRKQIDKLKRNIETVVNCPIGKVPASQLTKTPEDEMIVKTFIDSTRSFQSLLDRVSTSRWKKVKPVELNQEKLAEVLRLLVSLNTDICLSSEEEAFQALWDLVLKKIGERKNSNSQLLSRRICKEFDRSTSRFTSLQFDWLIGRKRIPELFYMLNGTPCYKFQHAQYWWTECLKKPKFQEEFAKKIRAGVFLDVSNATSECADWEEDLRIFDHD